jgi:transcriptional regulator GlxA family with amidase domain
MKLTLLVYDAAGAQEAVGPRGVFLEANRFLPAEKRYDVTIIGVQIGALAILKDMGVNVARDYLQLKGQSDMLLLVGGPRPFEPVPAKSFLGWLENSAKAARRFGAISHGVSVLGHAGLLNGHEITAHWNDAKRLSDQFPQTKVRPDKNFVRHGNVYTGRDGSAGIDLCLALVAEDWGADLAAKVAENLIDTLRRDEVQSKDLRYVAPAPEDTSVVDGVKQYVLSHIGEALSIDDIASIFGISRRTFTRVFSRQSKVTASAFIEQVRVDVALSLLEKTDLPLKSVAYRCGFHNATQMRMTFSRRISTTPRQFRDGVRRHHAA